MPEAMQYWYQTTRAWFAKMPEACNIGSKKERTRFEKMPEACDIGTKLAGYMEALFLSTK